MEKMISKNKSNHPSNPTTNKYTKRPCSRIKDTNPLLFLLLLDERKGLRPVSGAMVYDIMSKGTVVLVDLLCDTRPKLFEGKPTIFCVGADPRGTIVLLLWLKIS